MGLSGTVIAHVSDLHLDGSPRNHERAARVMTYLDQLPAPVDAVLVTGDVADHGLASEYEEVRTLLPTTAPVLACPGNHDLGPAFNEVLLGHSAPEGATNEVRTVGGVLFALCDSTIPGKAEGKLSDDTIGWLDEVLAHDPGTPAFVCFHHPPVVLHSPLIDAIRQFGEDRLAQVISRHHNVVALLCGHAHAAATATFAGRPLRAAPGVSSTLMLPWEHGDRAPYDDILSKAAPPMIAFHVLDEQRQLVTHYRVVA